MKSSGKSRPDTVQEPISVKKPAGAALVLLAAVGIGMVMRELRFRSWERHLAQAPKAVRPADTSKTKQASKEPQTQIIQDLPVEEVSVEPKPLAPEPAGPTIARAEADGQSNTAIQAETAAAPAEQDSRFDDPVVKEQRGRVALSLIGHNPEADEVWSQIINDPSLSANARQDLIEDLNEDGLSNPRNPSRDDLPVIKYRIELIEGLAPYAMDKVNADAFQEAHKDLVNMANRLARQ